MAELYTDNVMALDQATGEHEFDLTGGHDDCNLHQIQVKVSATPGAGTLTIAVNTPGMPDGEYADVAGNVDLTGSELVKAFVGYARKIRAKLTGFDADKTVDVYLATGVGS